MENFTTYLKNLLFEKLQDENTSFKKSDISIKKTEKGYNITIKEFECLPFIITKDYDDYFGYTLWIEHFDEMEMVDSKKEYDYKTAMKLVGYIIGTTF